MNKRNVPYIIQGYKCWIEIRPDGSRTTVQEHREIMEIFLGRKLLKSEHVHHKNENKLDNNLNNLEVLTASAHSRLKHKSDKPRKFFSFTCPQCGSVATKELSQVKHNRNLGKAGPFCSKQCAGVFSKQFHRRRGSPRMAQGASSKEDSFASPSLAVGTTFLS